MPALRLSYQYLPPLLKRCFAYCSLIPKDYEFEKDWLVELWMAENFLQVHQQKKDMKELGDEFFDDLLLRSFFQKSTRSTLRFVMHDLVNDLATSISGEFCSRLEKEDVKDVSKMTRHISCFGNYWKSSVQSQAIKANKLRTLIGENISSGIINNLLGKCKSLRVLSLHSNFDFNFDLCDVFYISYLKQLRYLKLKTLVKKLPASICSLYNLETLYLENCNGLEELPSLGILPSLKKLSVIGNFKIRSIGGEFYGNKASSAAVPFPSLQFLQLKYMWLWKEWDCQNASGAFPCLQKLNITWCPYLKNKLPERLPSLLKLQIGKCFEFVGPFPCAPKIQEIDLEYCGNVELEFPVSNNCLETPNVEFQIRHPLNFLRKLKLVNCCHTLEALPLDLFPKLKILRLYVCRKLEKLDGSITSLIELDILNCSKLVSLPEGMQTLFPYLTRLRLESCQEMEWPEGGLPSRLEILEIRDCPKLVASQMRWDLHYYTSLTVLIIRDEKRQTVDYKGLLPPNLKTLNEEEVSRPSFKVL